MSVEHKIKPALEFDQRQLKEENGLLERCSPAGRILRARERFGDSLILSTSFGMHSAVMLHLVSQATPGARVLFVDNGYLTPETYRFKQELVTRLDVEVYTYVPSRTRAEREALEGPVDEAIAREGGRERLADEIKIEPFERGLKMMRATAWMSGVMRGETSQRKGFDILMRRRDGLYKIHPILDWDSRRCHEYIRANNLPVNEHYNDVVKPDKQECGIHLTGMNQSLTASEL